MFQFPSPTGANYSEFAMEENAEMIQAMFPSPTGANYSESRC